jgi:hypothetical protein
MFTKVVRIGRNLTGATSEAYCVVRVWNMPHGMPQKTSPITNDCTLGAKKRMKMKHIIEMRAPIIVLRYPYLSLTNPLMIKPMTSPARAPLDLL